MVDEKEGGQATAVEGDKKGTLDSAVEKVREQKEETVTFKVLDEENPSGARRKVRVEIDQAEWDRRLAELFKNVKQQATLPGFRKGKAPLSLLQKRYREGAVNELVEKISPMVVRDYEADKKLVIYGTPLITEYNAKEGEPVTITLEMEIKPEIVPGKYKGLDVEATDHPLPEGAVENRLVELREQNAVFEEVERGWKLGDGVVIDYKIVGEKGKTLSHKANQFIDNPSTNLQPEVITALDEKKAGDQFDVQVAEIHYSITVKAVKEKKVPEINDDFAKDVGFEDEAELRAKTLGELEKVVNSTKADEAFEALTLKLVEAHQFDIPEALKAHVQKEMAESDMQYLRSTGYRPPRLQNIAEPEEYGKVLDQDAVQRVKGFLLIDAIGKKENIEVAEEDIQKALEEQGQEQGRKPVAVRATLERNKQWVRFLEQVRFEKIREFLLKENNITYVAPKEEEPADDAEPEHDTVHTAEITTGDKVVIDADSQDAASEDVDSTNTADSKKPAKKKKDEE